MSPRNHFSRKAVRSFLHIERLEQRLPLAGNVTAELTGSTLRLLGDDLANDVMVAAAADGRIAVIGMNTTINGGTAAFVPTGAVMSIVATLRGGDDAVGFGNSAADYASQRQFTMLATSPESVWSGEQEFRQPFDVDALQAMIDEVAGGVTAFSIPGGLTVRTGSGNDSVGLAGDVGGRVVIWLGPADLGNGVVIGSEFFASHVGAGVVVKGGDRNDLVAIGNVSVSGTVSASLRDGMNWLLVAGDPATPATIAALAYTGGTDVDAVMLAGDVTVRDDAHIFTGSRGEDSVSLFASDAGGTVKVCGNLDVDTGTGSDGDAIDVVGEIRGTVSVTTGGGRDTVSVSSSVGWIVTDESEPVPTVDVSGQSTIGLDLAIHTGAGSDLISIGTSTVGRNLTIDAGSGDDSVGIDSLLVKRTLFVLLGAGDDTLTITNVAAFATFLYGGSGTNSLSTDTATRSGNRTLRYTQFRTGAIG